MSRHCVSDPCCGGKHANTVSQATPAPPGSDTLRLRIQEMDCPTEEALLRKALGKEEGVTALDFDLMARVLTVHHQGADRETLEASIRRLGMTPEPLDTQGTQGEAPQQPRERWWPLILAALIALGAELAAWGDFATPWAPALLALSAIAMVGLPTWRKGMVALRHRTLNINALMSVAVTGALLIGHWAEAAMVIVLFTLAERIEARSLDRARHAIRELLALTPQQARVQQPDGKWRDMEADQITIGSLVRVRAGERVALDGEITRGHPALDESPITGESLPHDKTPGDTVFAGSINRHGEFDYRTSRLANDTTLARIIHAVEQAQASRAPTQRFVDRFSAIYTPAVFALAIATALLWPLLFAGAWLDGVYRALVLLVIACPCALVISTPVTIVSGLSAAARGGILIKGGSFLEQGHRLDWLAFDKTGTLTQGQPRQRHWQALVSDADEATESRLRQWAASLAGRSNHPVSRAIHEAAEQDGIDLTEVDAFHELPGRGVQGDIQARTLWLGNHRLVEERGLCTPDLEAQLETWEHRGHSVVVLGDEHRVLALFTVADPLKVTSAEAIEALHQLGVKTLLLSGDNAASVATISREAGIDEARGLLLPEDKLAAIEDRARRGTIGMVGDGINDAPALARADIGFAMGAAGSDTAIETADVALMDDDLRKLPTFVRLSRATRSVLIQNIAFAIGIKVVFLALAFTGHATLWMAVFADMGASLLVVANGLRLLRTTTPGHSHQANPSAAVASAGS
ncbi:heavy metal translocating P-type ATPase [Litchfieldella rifensis]|uniref:P-type Zn(2+) transporter n=1 Tax=Litchfieldella rifensis TaxID=762643 RepID=A0ABV7LVY5_9GAMM